MVEAEDMKNPDNHYGRGSYQDGMIAGRKSLACDIVAALHDALAAGGRPLPPSPGGTGAGHGARSGLSPSFTPSPGDVKEAFLDLMDNHSCNDQQAHETISKAVSMSDDEVLECFLEARDTATEENSKKCNKELLTIEGGNGLHQLVLADRYMNVKSASAKQAALDLMSSNGSGRM